MRNNCSAWVPARNPRLATKLRHTGVSSNSSGSATDSVSALRTPRWYAKSAISAALSSRLLASSRVHVPSSTMECESALFPPAPALHALPAHRAKCRQGAQSLQRLLHHLAGNALDIQCATLRRAENALKEHGGLSGGMINHCQCSTQPISFDSNLAKLTDLLSRLKSISAAFNTLIASARSS
jgi:hypothetical protein